MTQEELKDQVVIESGKTLSESVLYKLLEDYYAQEGINAWVDQIPFEVTSNPFIAHTYAQVTLAFILDKIKQNPDAINHPFYFLELGAGSGKFSFHFIKELSELIELSDMRDVKIKYVMSDFTENNFKYYENHQALKPFIEKGILDFARYDMNETDRIRLKLSGDVLDKQTLKNPLIIFANYVFDSAPNDVFFIRYKKVSKLAVDVTTKKRNVNGGKVKDLNKIDIKFQPLTNNNYQYGIAYLDQLLRYYQEHLENAHLMMPVATLRALKYLNEIANDQTLLIVTDKGETTLSMLDEKTTPPQLVFHEKSCFSMNVNFHAIGQFYKNLDGDVFHATSRGVVLETSVFVSGDAIDKLTATKKACVEYIEAFNPTDYYNVHELVAKYCGKSELPWLVSFLVQSRWNPYIYSFFADRFVELLPEAEPALVDFLAHNLHKVADNYYHLPKSEVIYFSIGLFYYSHTDYDQAIYYFKKSAELDYELWYTYYNLGLSYYGKEDFKTAKEYLEKSLEFSSDEVNVQKTHEMIEDVKNKMK